MHPQTSQILDRTSFALYSLEVSVYQPYRFRQFLICLTRQTVFYTPSTLTINQGDKIVGQLSCAPNRRNNRDLDISISYKLENENEEMSVHYKMCVRYTSPWHCTIIHLEYTLTNCQVLIYTTSRLFYSHCIY